MKTAYFWLTPQGKQLAEQLQAHFGGMVEPKADFAEAVRRAFADCDALVFVMATGIVVRTIAPLVQSKASDPAVLVLDQRGKHVISLLSGHLAGFPLHSVPGGKERVSGNGTDTAFLRNAPACLCCGNCRYHGICRGTPCTLSAAEKSGAGGGVQKADPAGTSGTVLPDVFAGAPPQSFGSGKAGDHWAEAGRAGDSGTV